MSDVLQEKTGLLKEGLKNALNNLPEELKGTIHKHAMIAGAAGLLPVPALDMLVLLPNLWLMYTKITEQKGITLTKNVMHTIATGTLTNLAAAYATTKVVSGITKCVPVLGTLAGIALDTVANYAITYVSGAVFLVILDIFADKLSTEAEAEEAVKETMQNTEEINDIFKEAKAEAKDQDFSAYKDEAQNIADQNKK